MMWIDRRGKEREKAYGSREEEDDTLESEEYLEDKKKALGKSKDRITF